MGKNRKCKNGSDQAQNYCFIETENLNQEVPEDFLTSDDFCIVQKKKGHKVSEIQDSRALFRSLSDLGKNIASEDASGCHTSFWTHKTDCSDQNLAVLAAISQAQTLNAELEGSVNDSATDDKDLIDDSAPSFAVNSSSVNISPDPSCSAALINGGVDVKSAFDANPAVKGSSCAAKKKNKKKEGKNKVVEEVEKLLEELEANDKAANELQTKSVINSDDRDLRSQPSCCNSINSSSFSSITEDTIDLSKVNIEPEKEVIRNDSNHVISKDNAIKNVKRKGKKVKAKQVIENSVQNNCDSDEVTDASSQEATVKETISCVEEEKSSQCKTTTASDRRKRPSKKQLAMIHEALKKAKEEEERMKKEAEARQKMAEEAEKIRLEKLRQEQEKKEKKKLKEKQRREKMKAEGRLLSKSQKLSRARMEATLAAFRQQGVDVPQINEKRQPGSQGPRLGNCKNFHRKRYDSSQSTQSTDSAIVVSERQKSESVSSQESSGKESLSDLPSSFDSHDESSLIPESDRGFSEESDGLDDNTCCDVTEDKNQPEIKDLKKTNHKKTELCASQVAAAESDHKLESVKYRSPVVCVLGHVDTGKTKLLDYIRKTHVQDSEAGGITQQIGATMIPQDALKEKCKMVKNFSSFRLKIPGLLVIDTPGHESFSNLRSRGSSVCDIAILVVDIMHGLEPQTIESLNLLKQRKTPFIVALNKVDRLYGWKSSKDDDIKSTIENQSRSTRVQFEKRCQEIILQFAKEYLNATLFYENKDPRSFVSMVPCSAVTGDGMGNVLSLVAQLTQSLMHKKFIYSDELEATVLEVKAIPGLGTTIDVILVNGRLQEGDTIVIAGQDGPIVTQIRSLLMPHPLKELRVKNQYIEYKAIEGAQGIKITGKDLEKSIAGLPLFVASSQNAVDTLKEEVNHLLCDAISTIKTSERGVYVQASTLGSLEALLGFLESCGIPYFSVKIGPVVKKDVMKASIMLEHDCVYAAILAFDVKIERDAQELADSLGVRIFSADIIYHLFDMYIKYRDDLHLKRCEEIQRMAVFPCKLKILPEFVFSVKDPLILGVLVEQGTLREGTPLCIPSRDLDIGLVSSIEMGNNKISCAKKGDEVCIRIDPKPGESPKTYGRHFDHEDLLISRISRQSIDACKDHFRNELQSSDWHLMVELKKLLHIV